MCNEVGDARFEEQKSVYDTYRARITEEDRLIGERMIWLILSEPMLFAGLTLATRDETSPMYRLLLSLLLGSIGIGVAFVSFRSVRAAQREIMFILTRYEKRYEDHLDDTRLLRLIGQDKNHKTGHLLPNMLPWVIIALWVAVISYFLVKFLGVPFSVVQSNKDGLVRTTYEWFYWIPNFLSM